VTPEEYLNSLDALGMIFGLENISRVLDRVGNPQKSLKSVHIGGTNGKGSVGAFLESVLSRAGYNVGFYTSPHLTTVRERIKAAGRFISQPELDELIVWLRAEVEAEGIVITYFEFVTVIAFEYFKRKKVDLGIFEVGLGGRLDATNTLTPLFSIITNIGLEHQNYLGSTEIEIAMEKAGIIKPGSRLVTGVRQPEVREAYEAHCRKLRTRMFLSGRDFHVDWETGGGLAYRGLRTSYSGLRLSLAGEHQGDNAALALAAVELLEDDGFGVPQEAIREGLTQTRWPARLEVVAENPLVIIDGAHNPDGARRLVKYLEQNFTGRKIRLVVGILSDKNYHEILKILSPVSSEVTLTEPHINRALPLAELKRAASKYFSKAVLDPDPRAAVIKAIEAAAEQDVVVVAGSLYLIGQVRPMFR
jgi:dihydrofolate synthase/folylpolyglutamate synthase